MNWGTCRLVCLQTIFANEGRTLTADDTNQEYLDAMPGKANEAMNQIALVGRPLLKHFRISIRKDAEESETEQELVLPEAKGKLYKLELKDYIPTFRAVDRLMVEQEQHYGPSMDWTIEGDTVLVLPGTAAEYTLYYKAYPKPITSQTPDNYELELTEDAASLVPIYMAAELYKDDDLSMATILRNEYEDGLEKLRNAYSETGSASFAARRRNTTGWW